MSLIWGHGRLLNYTQYIINRTQYKFAITILDKSHLINLIFQRLMLTVCAMAGGTRGGAWVRLHTCSPYKWGLLPCWPSLGVLWGWVRQQTCCLLSNRCATGLNGKSPHVNRGRSLRWQERLNPQRVCWEMTGLTALITFVQQVCSLTHPQRPIRPGPGDVAEKQPLCTHTHTHTHTPTRWHPQRQANKQISLLSLSSLPQILWRLM